MNESDHSDRGPQDRSSIGERIAARLLKFSINVLEIAARIPSAPESRHIPPQLGRAATAIGAIYAEACGASSRRDFIHKLRQADKEAREACYWLRLIAGRWPDLKGAHTLAGEGDEIVAMLSASIRTAQRSDEEGEV